MPPLTETIKTITDAGFGVVSFAWILFIMWQQMKTQKEITANLIELKGITTDLKDDHKEIKTDIEKTRKTAHDTKNVLHTVIEMGGFNKGQ